MSNANFMMVLGQIHDDMLKQDWINKSMNVLHAACAGTTIDPAKYESAVRMPARPDGRIPILRITLEYSVEYEEGAPDAEAGDSRQDEGG